jgi:two-component system OmpR family sensor kinase
LFSLFSIIVFFQIQTFLVNNLDTALLNGSRLLGDSLPEYRMKNKNDPKSLYEISSGGIEMLVNELEDEVQDVFTVNVAFAQLTTCSELSGEPPEVIVKTRNLKDKHLPFPQKSCKSIPSTSNAIEPIKNVFPFPIRQIDIKVYDYDKNPYILQVAVSFQEILKILKRIMIFAGLIAPLMLLIFTFGGIFFIKKVFSPIKKIVDLTNFITAQDLSKRLILADSNDEIGELSKTINGMLERLEFSFAQVKQFSEDVAHELKTPLAKLKCNAEISLRKERSKEDYQNAIISIIDDVNDLEQITNNLLLLSRMDSQRSPQSFEKFQLHEIVLSVFEETHQLAYEKKLIFDLNKINPVEIYADKNLIRTMLTNLISNAIKYTPSGGKISIDLQEQNKTAELTVTDNGVGISEKDLPHIFDRFFRIDPSRSLETGGSGLGLAIVQKIIQFHGGKISVKSHLGKGSSFSILLPRVK